MDALTDILAAARVSGKMESLTKFAVPWGVVFEAPPTAGATLHLLAEGRCCLRAGGHLPVDLGAGDIVLMSSGSEHMLSDHPESRALPLARARDRNAALLQTHGGETATVLSITYDQDMVDAAPVLAAMPEPVILRAGSSAKSPQLDLLIRLMCTEASAPGTGSGLVLPRLLDSLLALTLRCWLAEGGGDLQASWLKGLTDPNIRQVLNDIHAHPGDAWTLRTMSLSAGLSRATFARRFAQTMGETPMAYLNRWRLILAANRIKDGEQSVETAAHSFGYSSAAAFSRAFRREFGISPSRLRQSDAAADMQSATLHRISAPAGVNPLSDEAISAPLPFMTQTAGSS